MSTMMAGFRRRENQRDRDQRWIRALDVILVVVVLFLAVAYWQRGGLPGTDALLPVLRQDPVQSELEAEPFVVNFAGVAYEVVPRAEYEQWGLVVSHNDPEGIADITHDETSLDTRDVCVVWGANLDGGVYTTATFWSGNWTCFWRVPGGVTVSGDHLANNHLITDSDTIRETIADLRIGDQIRLKGMLADYKHPQWRTMRQTSTTRRDRGQGACEIVFVTELEILRPVSRFFYRGVPMGWALLIAVGLIRIGAWLRAAQRSVPTLVSES